MTHIIKAATLALTMLLITNCDSGKTTVKNYTLGTINFLDSNNWGTKKFRQIIINEANHIAYFLTNDHELYHANIQTGLTALLDANNWQQLTLVDSKQDGKNGHHKLDKEDPKDFRNIYPTKDGILLTTWLDDGSGNKDGALAYFEKAAKTPTFSWVNKTTLFTTALATENGGREFFIVQDALDDITSVPKGPNVFSGAWLNSSSAKFKPVKLAADQDFVYIVENGVGVSAVNKSFLGRDAVAAVMKDSEAKNWELVAGTPNDEVDNVLFHDNKLYISLETEGGVAIYDIAKQTTTAPNNAVWQGNRASSMRVQHKQVWANVDGANVIINDNGTITPSELSYNTILNNKFVSVDNLREKTFADGKTFYDNVKALEMLVSQDTKFYRLDYFGDDCLIEMEKNYIILTHQKKSFEVTGE